MRARRTRCNDYRVQWHVSLSRSSCEAAALADVENHDWALEVVASLQYRRGEPLEVATAGRRIVKEADAPRARVSVSFVCVLGAVHNPRARLYPRCRRSRWRWSRSFLILPTVSIALLSSLFRIARQTSGGSAHAYSRPEVARGTANACGAESRALLNALARRSSAVLRWNPDADRGGCCSARAEPQGSGGGARRRSERTIGCCRPVLFIPRRPQPARAVAFFGWTCSADRGWPRGLTSG